ALAIGRAYRAFEAHRLGRSMTVRRPDVTPEDVLALAQPLRQLEPGPLDKWLPHAATTWGTLGDLKALLPRVLELFAVGRLRSTPEVLFGKLAQLDVGDWPAPERAAIDDVVTAVWLATLARHPARIGYPAWRLLTALAELGNPLTPYLEDWELLLGVPGPAGVAAHRHLDDLAHRVDRVLERGGDLGGLFWSPQPEEAERLETWLSR
ncbi:MAG TPA: hypothetical protein VJ804_03625, partial [Acidimicrobiales bacterium]|nr:hypothetical protein [Acidimicrobiales bacterium]